MRKILKNAKNEKLNVAFSSLFRFITPKNLWRKVDCLSELFSDPRLVQYSAGELISKIPYRISLASRCARLTESLTTLANSPSIALRSFSPRLQNGKVIGPASKTVFSFSIAALHRVLQTKRELLCTLDPAVEDCYRILRRPRRRSSPFIVQTGQACAPRLWAR